MQRNGEPVLEFDQVKELEAWYEKNHETQHAFWIRFYKKSSGIKKVEYPEALDVALCYGWIDGIVNKLDEKSYLQRFTPRRSKSIWSEINKGHIARLVKDGRMKEAGMLQMEAAKKDGRWEKAYGGQAVLKVPEDFLDQIKKNKKAYEFFEKLNKSNKFAMCFQIETAKKEETRKRRIKKFVEMMQKGEKLY